MDLLAGSNDFRARAGKANRAAERGSSSDASQHLQHRTNCDAHFENLPPRYFEIHSARQIVSDLTLAHRFMHLQIAEEDKALEPVVIWHNEPDRGYTSVHICTWDRAGLFAKIAGSLAAAGLNILSAQIFTRNDGIILDTFFVNDAKGAALAKKEEKEASKKS